MKYPIIALLLTAAANAATTLTFTAIPASPVAAFDLRVIAVLDGNTVTITNESSGTLYPTVCNIYFDGVLLDDFVIANQSQTVAFQSGGSPTNLAGGNTVGFTSDVRFSAGVHTGLDPNESITFTYTGTIDRIGVHVQQVGEFQDLSASLVTVPESSTLCLTSLAALTLIRRKRN